MAASARPNTALRENRRDDLLVPISVSYLALPCLLFAVTWLRPGFAVLSVLILAGFAALLVRDVTAVRPSRGAAGYALDGRAHGMPPWRAVIPSLMLLVVWVLLSGTGGFGFQHRDYRASNAILYDLVTRPWPPTVVVDGVQEPLVYYVAYYLPAAGAGQVFGWEAANVLLWIWTVLGACLSLLWFFRASGFDLHARPVLLFCVALLFCLAGGLDLLGSTFLRNQLMTISSENEWWAGYFQYSSNTTLLFWVPQQAIPAWLATGLILDAGRNGRAWTYAGLVLAALLIWSPIALLGILPFAVAGLGLGLGSSASVPWRARAFWAASLGALVLGGIQAAYVLSNRFSFPSGLLWRIVQDHGTYVRYLIAFWLLEFGIIAALVWAVLFRSTFAEVGKVAKRGPQSTRHDLERLQLDFGMDRADLTFLLLAVAVLGVLPLFTVGIYNDLAMRGSIPALFVLWASVARLLFRSTSQARRRNAGWLAGMALVMLLGIHPAIVNISESIDRYHFGPPSVTTVQTTATANDPEIVAQRLGNRDSFFNLYLGR